MSKKLVLLTASPGFKTEPLSGSKFAYGLDQFHIPSIAFRHLPPRKDVVKQSLEFGSVSVTCTRSVTVVSVLDRVCNGGFL